MVAYGTYIVCSTDLLSSIIVEHSHTEEHHHGSEENGHQSHSHEHEDQSSDDDCCNDFTDSFFTDAKLLSKQLQVKFSFIGDAIIIQPATFKIVGFENFGSLSHFIDPPPKAVHRRILYQSFTI